MFGHEPIINNKWVNKEEKFIVNSQHSHTQFDFHK